MEAATDYVCMWLDFYKATFTRLNGEDLFTLKGLGSLPKNEDVAMVWYRRKVASFPTRYKLKKENFDNQYVMDRFLNNEYDVLHNHLCYLIDKQKWLNDPATEDKLNKLSVLFLAKKLGLNIPHTEVLTDKRSLIELMQIYPQLIVKPLSECVLFSDNDGAYFKMLTEVISIRNIKAVPETFFPSLVQQGINKKFELRVFYLAGVFYAMAIFSQENKKTVSDFRNYDDKRPNRTVPYILPYEIENKLSHLMTALSFETGSIDLMVDREGNYYFLEINPEGQFGMVSHPCNYYLEREMAKVLTNKCSA